MGGTVIRIRLESPVEMKAEKIWESLGLSKHLATSVFHGGHLYGFDNFILKCVEVNT